MAIDEATLTKVQLRKLSALQKSVGTDLGEEVFIYKVAGATGDPESQSRPGRGENRRGARSP